MINDKYMELIKDENKKSYLKFKRGDAQLDSFSSHQPVLIHTLNTISEGLVLEYGTGDHSTPIMHIICGMQGRKLISLETDIRWLKKFEHYKNDFHSFVYMDERIMHRLRNYIFNYNYAIAFIDGHPGEMRQKVIEKLFNKVDYFVVHDTEEWAKGFTYPGFSYKWDFSKFKHVYNLDKDGPGVSLLSNLNEINKDLLTIFE